MISLLVCEYKTRFLTKCLERLTVFSSAGRWSRFGTKSPFSVDASICKYFFNRPFFKVSKFALSHKAFKSFVLFVFLVFFFVSTCIACFKPNDS